MNTQGAGLPTNRPGTEDLFAVALNQLKKDFHCAKIGQIQAYDSSKQTVSVQIVFERTLGGTSKPTALLTDVPVHFPQAGGYSLRFTPVSGDTCLLLFNDVNLDAWFQDGQIQPPAAGDSHALGDAIAIMGINSLANLLPAWSGSGIAIVGSDGTTQVGIDSGKIYIKNSSQDLLTILQTLITGILGMKTSNGGTLVDTTGDVLQAQTDLSELLS